MSEPKKVIKKSTSAAKKTAAKKPAKSEGVEAVTPQPVAEAQLPDGAQLAIADARHPVTVAFDYCFKQGSAGVTQLEEWKIDLYQAVTEGAKKFVGFNNQTAMKKALDINLGLMSLGLLLRVNGRVDAESWAEALLRTPLKDLLKEAVGQVRALVYTQEYLFPELGERPLRETVLAIATARDSVRKNVWNGYELFLRERDSRRSQQGTDRLARHLIQTLLRKEPEAWVRSMNKKGEDTHEMVMAEETVNTLILRFCALKSGERFPEDVYVSAEYLKRIRADYDADPKGWTLCGQARFAELAAGCPAGAREYLESSRWWDLHLKGGPPKLGKRPVRKQSEDDDEEGDAPAQDIPGLSGIYLTRIYA